MTKRNTILLLFATLFGVLLGSKTGVKGQAFVANSGRRSEAQIKQNGERLKTVPYKEGLGGYALLSVPSSNRVASSRPTRLLPTHGGKPTNSAGRWAKGKSFNPQLFPLLRPCRCHCRQRMATTSPRLRYVIALRRLLC